VIEVATPRLISVGSLICRQGEPSDSCFFSVSGTVVVDIPGQDKPIRIAPGQIIGEFGLWIPNISRTATVRAIDEGLLLGFRNVMFREILSQAPLVAEGVYGIIKGRILENVLRSQKLFPLDNNARNGEWATIPASCEKYAPAARLDLTTSVYVVFSGRVQIDPPDGGPLVLTAIGGFGTEQVVGIISDIGSPDGPEATVLEETVAVRLSHATVRELQRHDSIGTAWSALCGERLRAARRCQGHGESRPAGNRR
jgi:CRP-like cAMP-binding protein